MKQPFKSKQIKDDIMKKLFYIIPIIIIFLTIFLLSNKMIYAKDFVWPTTGYIGYRYYDNNGAHNGIDIWSQEDGGWNGDVEGESNPVYAVYSGTLIYEDTNGFIVKHEDALYSNYWHLRNKQLQVTNPPTSVTTNTLLAYQDIANEVVHLHLTISTTSSDSGHTDPSSYFDMQLNMNNANPVAWGTYIERPNTCGSANVILQGQTYGNGESLNCSATNSLRILPNFTATNGSDIHLYIEE